MTTEIADTSTMSTPEMSTPTLDAPTPVVCYAGTRRKATEVAQVVANRERCLVYVLKGYRPNRRGFRSPAYYVSLHASPKIEVDGLPPLELVGPPYSSPRLLDTLSPLLEAPEARGLLQ